jgi:hypothetical protein
MSVHEFRKPTIPSPTLRTHYSKILAFVFRNRFAIASQIQRRFPGVLKSDRTTRRQLAEMEALGLLATQAVTSVSPLMPKVYFVTSAGLRQLRKAYAKQNQEWQPSIKDRRRTRGQSFPHVFHELAITEFLLGVWESVESRPDLELLRVDRRLLATHPAFELYVRGHRTRLQPDGMFLFRHASGGMMCCLLEVDTGSQNDRQITAKLAAYDNWSRSSVGQRFICDQYQAGGAKSPTSAFRLLFVCCTDDRSEDARLTAVSRSAAMCPEQLRNRIWITQPRLQRGWIRGKDLVTAPRDMHCLATAEFFPART